MNPTHLDSRYGATLLDAVDSSLLREEAAPAASETAGAAPETAAEVAAWIEWDTRAERWADV